MVDTIECSVQTMGRRALLKLTGIFLPKSNVDGNKQKYGLSSQDFLDKSCRQFKFIGWIDNAVVPVQVHAFQD